MQVRRKTIAKLIAVVFVFNLVVMGTGAWLAYEEAPPIPEQVVGPDGDVFVTGQEIRDGKRTFQRNGPMNHGSLLGNGAYYGADYTADALELKIQHMRDYYARERHGESYADLPSERQAAIADVVEQDLDEPYEGGEIRYSAAELYAHEQVRETYVQRYHQGSHERGVGAGMIDSASDARQFGDFALWTAWFSHTDRLGGEGGDHSYTNDWPYQPGAGLFLPPLLTGHEPTRQSTYVNGLLAAIVVVVIGGLTGIWLGSNGYIGDQLWWLLGNERLEYLEVGTLWQGGILLGFGIWAVLAIRGLKPLLDREPVYGLARMILYAGGSIALLFTAGFLFTPSTNITVTEFWRWWVVHMWVEGAFEFFIVASGVWNFVGAGVLGFFINLRLINYYEHGTYLTVGHAHVAIFGAFGFLALGMVTYMLQLSIEPERWDGSWLRAAFWCWNVGLGLMVSVSVLPVGFLQLEAVFTQGYAAGRSLAFYNRPIIQTLFWARLPGDTLIILGTMIYAADLLRKRFVLRASEDDSTVEDMAVAEGVLSDD